MIGNAVPAARLTGQNVRGLSQLKLEKVLQFMKERRLLVTCLMETWQVTPQGWYSEDIDGFLVIHHGETAQSCNRGRSGVAIGTWRACPRTASPSASCSPGSESLASPAAKI